MRDTKTVVDELMDELERYGGTCATLGQAHSDGDQEFVELHWHHIEDSASELKSHIRTALFNVAQAAFLEGIDRDDSLFYNFPDEQLWLNSKTRAALESK